MSTTPEGVENTDRSLILNPAIMTPAERLHGRFMRAPDHDGGIDSAADAILNRWLDAGTLSKDDEGAPSAKGSETDPDDDEEHESEQEDLQDEGAADEDDDQGEEAEDDGDESDDESEEPAEAGEKHVVKITVDGEERTVSVKDLKRLYGQEASLTRKSQEVADARKKAEADGARYVSAMQAMITKAQQKFEPYSKVDWLVAQQQLEPDEFAALRAEARQVHEELQFLTNGVEGTLKEHQEAQAAARAEEAKQAIAVLEREVPNWSRKLYDDIRGFAVTQGLPEAEVNQVTDPTIIKLLHMAMQFSQASQKLTTKKTVAAPKKVIKTKGKASRVIGKQTADAEMVQLRKTGSQDDAAAAFLARWALSEDSD